MCRQFDDSKVAFADGLLQLVIADAYQSVDRVVRIGRARHRRRSRCHFPPTAAVAGTMLNACYFSSYCGHSVDFLESRDSDESELVPTAGLLARQQLLFVDHPEC